MAQSPHWQDREHLTFLDSCENTPSIKSVLSFTITSICPQEHVPGSSWKMWNSRVWIPLLNLLRTHTSIHRKGNQVLPTQDIHWGSMEAMEKSSGHLLHLRAPELTWLGVLEPWALHAHLQLLLPLPLPQDPCLSLKICPHTPTTWECVFWFLTHGPCCPTSHSDVHCGVYVLLSTMHWQETAVVLSGTLKTFRTSDLHRL